jgi:glycosyltransferase involved in cell wall biosynthesis
MVDTSSCTMRIAIVNVTSGGLSGGYQKYLRRLVPLLRQDSRVTSVDVFMHPLTITVDEAGFGEGQGRDAAARSARALREAVSATRPDVVFVPTARYFRVPGVPTVVMVRNMEPLTVPWGGNSFGEGVRNLARAAVARWACVRANRVIAVSRYVRDFLSKEWRLGASKIGVVYHGVDPISQREPGRRPPSLMAVREEEHFLFTAGSIRPARGLEDAIRALAVLQSEGTRCRLVVAGAPDPSSESYALRLHSFAANLGVAHNVTWTGRLSEAEMDWCYSNCVAFVMTSRAEACPNIALEAMSHGTVCVACDNAPMPEFFAAAATYYHAGDSSSLATALKRTLSTSPDALRALRVASMSRAADFEWEATARNTIDQLQAAADFRK